MTMTDTHLSVTFFNFSVIPLQSPTTAFFPWHQRLTDFTMTVTVTSNQPTGIWWLFFSVCKKIYCLFIPLPSYSVISFLWQTVTSS